MTMATTTINTPTGAGRTLEELVDRLIDSLFSPTEENRQRLARRVHEARRLRQADDLDGALAVLAGADLEEATEQEVRWTYAEWLDVARRRFADRDGAVVYSPATGRAAALAPRPDGSLEVLAVLGMRWRPGKVVSRRSLRGLQALTKGSPR